MARKQILENLENNMANYNADVRNAELAGELKVLGSKLDDLSKNVGDKINELGKKIDLQANMFDRYVTKDEYQRHIKDADEKIKEIDPVIKWVNDRQAVEKFLYGAVALIGVTNIVLLVKILFFA
jgi:alcohol dehydrogenase class IV